MLALILLLVVVAVLAVGAAYQWHIRRHLPHDLAKLQTEGLPDEASIRSGELGLGTAASVWRNMGHGP
jgi:hypothetical protein